MAKFVLTAQLNLQAPKNANKVLNDVRKQLQGVTIPVQLKGAAQAQKSIQKITQSTQQASSAANALGRSFGLAVKRFAAFTVASRAVSLFTNSLAKAVDEAIDFQKEIVKIAQVTGKTTRELGDLQRAITKLSVGLGTSSKDLLQVTRILSQAGVKAGDLKVALDALAKTTLAPTFEDITETAEGAVAILAQFGQGVGALEKQLSQINAVAGQFAVESSDLIGAVRRFGGVFKAAGGELEELLGLFTAVRATTRESAESISTGLRTIFTRIQRPKTIEFLRQFGVELTNLDGTFVGPFEAAKRLSAALKGLGEGDLQFIRIAEELGGFRQIGKVIPLLQQFETAERARQAAIAGGNSLTKDAETAQQSLANQITKVKEEFLALVRGIADSKSFQVFTRTALDLASALIKIADSLKPLLPLLATLAAFKLSRSIGQFFGGAGSAIRGLQSFDPKRKNAGGRILGFNSGGFVPGTGNRDTVPAMLTPGEFVIKKSSASKLGAGTLEAMNGYNKGGTVTVKPNAIGGFFLRPPTGDDKDYSIPAKKQILISNPSVLGVTDKNVTDTQLAAYGSNLTQKEQEERGLIEKGKSKLSKINSRTSGFRNNLKGKLLSSFTEDSKKGKGDIGAQKFDLKGKIDGFYIGGDELTNSKIGDLISEQTQKGLRGLVKGSASKLKKFVDIPPIDGKDGVFESSINNLFEEGGAQSTIEGYLLEGVISAVTNAKLAGGQTAFDFPESSFTGAARKRLGALFGAPSQILKLFKADAKRTGSSGSFNSIIDKLTADINKGNVNGVDVRKRKNSGGGVGGTDTVPALLTPGEFVVNKKSAQSIGYGNLTSMNRDGVARFAKGGPVGIQAFAGGSPGGVKAAGGVGKVADAADQASNKLLTFGIAAGAVQTGLEYLRPKIDENSGAFAKLTSGTITALQTLITTVIGVTAALQAFGIQLNKETLKKVGGDALDFFTGKGKVAGKAQQKVFDLGAKGRQLGGRITGGGVRRGGKLGKAQEVLGKSIGRLGKFIQGPKVLGAVKGFATALGPLVAGLTIGVGIVSAANSVIDNYTQVHEKAKKAIEDGDTARAEETSVRSANAKAANKVAVGLAATGAVIGSAFGPVGSIVGGAIGGLVGGIFKLVASTGVLDDAFNGFRDTVGVLFTGVSTEQIKKRAGLEAALVKTQKELALGSKEAATALQQVAAGTKSFEEAFAEGSLTRNVRNTFDQSRRAAEVEEITKRDNEKVLFKKGGFKSAKEGNIGAIAALTFAPVLVGAAELFGKDIEKANKEAVAKRLEVEEKGAQEFSNALSTVYSKLAKGRALRRGGDPDSIKQSILEDDPALKAKLERDKATAAALNERKSSGEELTADEERLLALSEQQIAEFNTTIDNAVEAAKKQKALIDALNFGLSGVADQLDATVGRLQTLVNIDQLGNQFEDSLVTLDAAFSSAASSLTGAELDNAIGSIEDTLREAGLSEDQIQRTSTTARDFATAQGRLSTGSDAFKNIQRQLRTNPDAGLNEIKKTVGAEITAGLDPESAKKIQAAIDSAEFSDTDLAKLESGNIEPLLNAVNVVSEEFNKQTRDIVEKRAKAEGLLIQAIQNRQKAEQDFVSAQRRAIDLQLEAGKAFEDFGGAALTSDQKRGANLAKFNVGADFVSGVGGLTTGSAEDIQRVNAQITSRFSNLENRAAVGAAGGTRAFSGAAGAETDQREKLKALQQDLIATTKAEIQAKKEELDLIKKKNAAEKSSLEKLLEGDVKGFLEGQATAGAAAALRTGDAGLAGLFGSGALGRGLKSLEGTGESADTLNRAGQLALGSVGLGGDARAAGVLTGTTEAERKVQQEGQALAQTLGQLAQDSTELERQEIRTKTAIINAQKLEIANLADPQARAQGLARGGTVYANRGMFVPRGTDTVPAMLTPGEFVVNRSAVNRGNNLQILRAMNTGGGASAPGALSGGGQVGYYNIGGIVDALGGAFSSGMSGLEGVFSGFTSAVDKLINSKFSVSLDTTNVNVNFNGASFLSSLKDDIRDELLDQVGNEISKYKANTSGDLVKKDSVL